MLDLTMDSLDKMIKSAVKIGACEESIEEIRRFTSVSEILAYRKAPEWAHWYAVNVIKGRWPEAEEVIRQDAYETHWYDKFIGDIEKRKRQ